MQRWVAREIEIRQKVAPVLQREFTVHDNILIKGTRILISHSLQNEILNRAHDGHQGIVKCRERARSSVWWLGPNSQLEAVVKNCQKCIDNTNDHTYLLNFRSNHGKKLPRICSS